MTNQEAAEFNRIVDDFLRYYYKDRLTDNFRLGQAFYNRYYGKIYNEPKPELFYEEDNRVAGDMILEDIKEYVTNGGTI